MQYTESYNKEVVCAPLLFTTSETAKAATKAHILGIRKAWAGSQSWLFSNSIHHVEILPSFSSRIRIRVVSHSPIKVVMIQLVSTVGSTAAGGR